MESNEQTLYLLVDFDNLDEARVGIHLNGIVDHLLSRAANGLEPEDVTSCKWVNIRLYHGWFQNDVLTEQAQDLLAEIPSSPTIFSFPHLGKVHNWHVTVKLAFSLLSVPSVDLMQTFRVREKLRGIGVTDPVEAGCDPAKCRVLNTGTGYVFITNYCILRPGGEG